MQTGKVCEEMVHAKVNGKDLPVMVTATPRFSAAGEIIGAVELLLPAPDEVGFFDEIDRITVASARET